jgi:hypothetical protein
MIAPKQAARMDENRRAIRRRVLKSATIEFDRGAYSCAVRNLSEAGAALDVPYALAIPHEFTLITETDQASRHLPRHMAEREPDRRHVRASRQPAPALAKTGY